jgi:hypothetical protein
MINEPYTYWFFMGTLYLCFMTYQDVFHKMLVDERHNYLMLGATIPLLFILQKPVWLIFAALGIAIAVMLLAKFSKAFGEADQTSIMWVFTGFTVIGWNYLNIFVMIFLFCIFITIVARKILKIKKATPGMPIFLLSFVATIIYNLFYYVDIGTIIYSISVL